MQTQQYYNIQGYMRVPTITVYNNYIILYELEIKMI